MEPDRENLDSRKIVGGHDATNFIILAPHRNAREVREVRQHAGDFPKTNLSPISGSIAWRTSSRATLGVSIA